MQTRSSELKPSSGKPKVGELRLADQKALNHYGVLFGLTWLLGLLIVTIFLTVFDGPSVPGAG